MTTLDALAAALETGSTTTRALTEACLAQAETGEGERAFTSVDRAGALAAADAADAQRKAGV